jgi:hypothetical protein
VTLVRDHPEPRPSGDSWTLTPLLSLRLDEILTRHAGGDAAIRSSRSGATNAAPQGPRPTAAQSCP